MMTLLAAIQGSDLLVGIISLIVVGLIAWLLYFLIDYVAVPEPINKILRVVLMIVIVIILINFLLSLIGKPFIQW